MDLKKFKIVDSHHHLWDLSMKKHPWLYKKPLINFRYGNYEQICKNEAMWLLKGNQNQCKLC